MAMQTSDKILVLGSRGLVGSALVRSLKKQGFHNLLTPVREELDLAKQDQVQDYFQKNKPAVVFNAAAKVGGILANNTYRADFIHQNLMIQENVFNAAFETGTKRLLFLGSSCIYPKHSPQPIKEEYLLTGPLEPTNEPYAIAKIAGLKTAENFRRQYGLHYISVMPTNLYGVNDNFDPNNSHVIPGLIVRMQKAIDNQEETFPIWGTGKPRREFLYVDDMADACVHVMQMDDASTPDWMNVGTGEDIEIGELAAMIARLMGYKGKLVYDTSKPDGTMVKRLDVERILATGWKPRVSLEDGLMRSIEFYRNRSHA
jgi:GDP-L-fucose synthase